jgi:hypothetical protein
VELTQFIDNKIESIFKLATEPEPEESTNSLEQTAEFLEQLIELIEDLCWLILNVPSDRCSRNLLKKYKNGYESILDTLMGLERIWRGIRKGTASIPRNRDYATEYIFKNIQITALNDLKEQWNTWIDHLRESNEELKKDSGSFERKKCQRIITVTFNIFKKIKLTCFHEDEDLSNELCDELIDKGESIMPLVKGSTRLLLIYPRSNLQVCDQIFKLNSNLDDLIKLLNLMDEGWFKNSLNEINLLTEEIMEMNPQR